MDILPEGQVDMLPARVRLPLQHVAQRLRHAWPPSAGYSVLRHLWLGVVGVCCQDLADRDFKDTNANEWSKMKGNNQYKKRES